MNDAEAPDAPRGRRLLVLSLAALGVVYGDIGTSPLYAIRECFFGEYSVAPTPDNVFGVLSLIFWALLLVVTVKYLGFIMRADNRGEGGVIALMAQILSGSKARSSRRSVLVAMGLFGAALLYGDGMITPAISVLSAVEGLQVATSRFEPYVVPITVVILVGLFAFQRRGTAGVGAVFGPVTLIWLAVISILGGRAVLENPGVLAAMVPTHGLDFFLRNRAHGFLVLGAVFLVVTGAEALYADMGHFGKRPIRLAWGAVVLPALLVNYYGQGALLIADPEAAHNPFYGLAPGWALYPLVVLATAATIIASQAVISGAFSLTRQAVQLGYCPRLRIEHTSHHQIGQIYIPEVNWVLMVATVGLVLVFRSSSTLAAAYGVAVTTTMVIASTLFFFVARQRWGWSLLAAGLPTLVFLAVDLSFFSANFVKIGHGAWFPLVIGAMVFSLLATWKKGREILARRLTARSVPFDEFLASLADEPPIRVPGTAVYMTGNPSGVPPALRQNLKHNKVLHQQVVVLHVMTEEVPRVPKSERVVLEPLGNGLHRLTARYGFMEEPHVPRVLRQASSEGLDIDFEDASFFLGRERLLSRKRPGMRPWRARLFAFMSRNALGATAFYHISPKKVVELGAQIEL